jgi:tRNA(Ile)-lysidine synthase
MPTQTKYIKSFTNFIGRFGTSHHLFSSKSCILVSLSGGGDSVALLIVLKELLKSGKLKKLRAIHFNHGTRAENREEEEFCKKLCGKLRVPLQITQLQLSPNLSNFEKVARLKRREAIFKALKEGELVAMGHHLDDSFEWHLMQSLRSSGLKASLGIPVTSGPIIRPLMCVSRKHILKFLQSAQMEFKEDPSNQDNKFDRNYVRNVVLPRIRKRYPKYLKHYVYRSNQLAKKLKCHQYQRHDGQVSFQYFEGQGGVGVVCKGSDLQQDPNLYSVLEGLIKKVSSKDRGNLNLQITKMIESALKGKFGPYSFSGGVKGFSFYQSFFFLPKERLNYFNKLDEKLFSQLEKGETNVSELSLLEKETPGNMIFPFLFFLLEGEMGRPNDWPFKPKESLKRIHPLFPKTSEYCIQRGIWFHGLFWAKEKWSKNKLIKPNKTPLYLPKENFLI